MREKKLKYEKPVALDMRAVSPVHGADCNSGSLAEGNCGGTGYSATEGCAPGGNDPHLQPTCDSGYTASSSCYGDGGTAAEGCSSDGGDPGWGCFSGSSP
jgi:hypothetical protein